MSVSVLAFDFKKDLVGLAERMWLRVDELESQSQGGQDVPCPRVVEEFTCQLKKILIKEGEPCHKLLSSLCSFWFLRQESLGLNIWIQFYFICDMATLYFSVYYCVSCCT